MKSNLIRDALDTVNPTSSQKARMRAVLEAQLPAKKPAGRKYQAKHTASRRWNWIPAVAVLFVVVLFGGWYLTNLLGGNARQMSAGNASDLSELYSSAVYLAHEEWTAYMESYDPDGSIYASDRNISGQLSEGYTIYGIFTLEMTDQFHEILDKYGLTHQWQAVNADSLEQICQTLGISSVFHSAAQGVSLEFENGLYYPSGSYTFNAITTMTYEGSPWVDPVEYQFLYNKKDDFVCNFPELALQENYEQWNYTTTDGVPLTLAVSRYNALIYGETEQGIVLVVVQNSRVGNILYGEMPMYKAAMEAFAETFDFSRMSADRDAVTESTASETEPSETITEPSIIQTEPTTQGYEHVIKKYEDAIAQNWEPAQCAENDISFLVSFLESPQDLGYALIDLDGNGNHELIISNGNVIFDLYTLTDEGLCHILSGAERNSYTLCADNVIANRGSNSAASATYNFYRLSGAELVQEQMVTFDAGMDPDNPWFLGFSLEPVTEAEAQSVIDSYQQVVIETKPLAQRP